MKKFDDLPSPEEEGTQSGKGVLEVSRRNLLAGTAGAVAVTGLAAGSALAKGAKHPHPMGGGKHPMGGDGMGMGMAGKPPRFANPKDYYQPFMEPSVVTSDRTGLCRQELNVGFSDITFTVFDDKGVPGTRTQCVRCYNNAVPGTTFEIYPGDRLEFTLNNLLPPNQPVPPAGSVYSKYDCQELMDHNFPGCFNTTNLHTHGLHVSPKSKDGISSDDVGVRVFPANDRMSGCMPGEDCSVVTRKYCIQLPTFHAPGTHWYHAHVHGATGLQVSNGLAGALIVKEPPDQRIDVDKEVLWMVQETIGGENSVKDCTEKPELVYKSGDRIYSNMYASLTECKPGGIQPYGQNSPAADIGFTVNSLNSPTLKMLPNEIQRWRIIDGTATPRGIFNFVILQVPRDAKGQPVEDKVVDFSNRMYLIAVDGITFYGHKPQRLPNSKYKFPFLDDPPKPLRPKYRPGGWGLAPGNRADVLVSLPEGDYEVWRYDNAFTGGSNGSQVLAKLEVRGPSLPYKDPASIALPGWEKAPCYLLPIGKEEINADDLNFDFHVDRITFPDDQGAGSYFGGFKINGKVYGNPGGDHPIQKVDLGDVRRTTLVNSGGGNHPFHIHVNPFQVEGDKIDKDGPDDPTNWRWWDTILVPEKQQDETEPRKVLTRSRYVNYDGKYVFHCHILIHEDAGMMWDFKVDADPNNKDYPPVDPCTKLEKCQMGRGYKAT